MVTFTEIQQFTENMKQKLENDDTVLNAIQDLESLRFFVSKNFDENTKKFFAYEICVNNDPNSLSQVIRKLPERLCANGNRSLHQKIRDLMATCNDGVLFRRY